MLIFGSLLHIVGKAFSDHKKPPTVKPSGVQFQFAVRPLTLLAVNMLPALATGVSSCAALVLMIRLAHRK